VSVQRGWWAGLVVQTSRTAVHAALFPGQTWCGMPYRYRGDVRDGAPRDVTCGRCLDAIVNVGSGLPGWLYPRFPGDLHPGPPRSDGKLLARLTGATDIWHTGDCADLHQKRAS
jgi:hypothetical protein